MWFDKNLRLEVSPEEFEKKKKKTGSRCPYDILFILAEVNLRRDERQIPR